MQKSWANKKQNRKFNKTKERRKGPGLKARIEDIVVQRPEGHCSLRGYKTTSAGFISRGLATTVADCYKACRSRGFPQPVRAKKASAQLDWE
jgi:hypothetical protein